MRRGIARVMENIPDPKALGKVAAHIEASRTFLLTCHVKPDGDAIGSMLGLGLALMDMGKDVHFYSEDSVPEVLGFLPGSNLIRQEPPSPLPAGTALVILDCNEPGRIGRRGGDLVMGAAGRILLDHHIGGDAEFFERGVPGFFAAYQDSHIFATGAIVFWLLEHLALPVTREIATNLYAAILSDTGCFRHSNTTITALSMASSLVRAGADPHFTATRLYQSYPLRRQQLLALVLKTLDVRCNGKIAILHATPEMFRACGATEEDAEDFVAYARCIETVELAIFMKEVYGGQVSVSLRSKESFNVEQFARSLGGGGHFHAAGFRMAGNVSEVREIIISRLASLEIMD